MSAWRVSRMLRGYRDVQQCSLRDVAKACGVSHVYISDVEAGRKFPSARWILGVALELGWTPSVIERAWLSDAHDIALAELLEAKR